MAVSGRCVTGRIRFSRVRLAAAGLAAVAAVTAFSAPAMAQPASSAAVSVSSQGLASLPLPPNNLALTPPMGWNDWYQYRCSVTESAVLANARVLVSSGLAKLGYTYVNLDDCWMATTRTAAGQLREVLVLPLRQSVRSGIW